MTTVAELSRERTALLANLTRLRPVTPAITDALADQMNLRRGDVDEVVSFYSYLRLPLETTRVCTGPMCAARGAVVPAGAVGVPCLGHCEHAPVSMRGADVVPVALHRAGDGPSIGLLSPDVIRRAPRRDPATVLAALRASGLRGCGGAGFPTWRKWEAVRAQPGPRAVVVNADEGEPGTFKDRYVMELRPHLLLEGLEAAMQFVEAERAWIYVREEYTRANATLERAIAERRMPVTIVRGAGAYVCGEETALLESMEGRRGEPRQKPPFPAERGYLGMPTLVQNVETLAHVPAVLRSGGERWPRTRLWSVSGCVARPGCYEAPVDSTVGELLELAGGATEPLGAIVPGGAASGFLPPDALDRPGCGSGAVQFFPATYPIRELLRETLRFFAEESCGKCAPCRAGTRTLLAWDELPPQRLADVLDVMEQLSVCGLGQSVPTVVRSALEHWPELAA
jgi:formate dehydrogenase